MGWVYSRARKCEGFVLWTRGSGGSSGAQFGNFLAEVVRVIAFSDSMAHAMTKQLPLNEMPQTLVRSTDEEREAYKACAVMSGLSVNSWIRTVLAKEVMAAYSGVHRPLPEMGFTPQAAVDRARVAIGAAVSYRWAGAANNRLPPDQQF